MAMRCSGKKAALAAKARFRELKAESGPHKKSMVDWGAATLTEDGFEVEFREPISQTRAYGWLRFNILRAVAMDRGEWEFIMLDPSKASGAEKRAPAASAASAASVVCPAASAASVDPLAAVDCPAGPAASAASVVCQGSPALVPWAASSPTMKLLRGGRGVWKDDHAIFPAYLSHNHTCLPWALHNNNLLSLCVWQNCN